MSDSTAMKEYLGSTVRFDKHGNSKLVGTRQQPDIPMYKTRKTTRVSRKNTKRLQRMIDRVSTETVSSKAKAATRAKLRTPAP